MVKTVHPITFDKDYDVQVDRDFRARHPSAQPAAPTLAVVDDDSEQATTAQEANGFPPTPAIEVAETEPDPDPEATVNLVPVPPVGLP